MSALPLKARERLILAARVELADLRRPVAAPVIPVSQEGWQSAISDADITGRIARIAAALSAPSNSDLASSAKLLSKTVRDMLDGVRVIADDLWCLDAFEPSGGGGIALLTSLIDACASVMDGAVGLASPADVRARRNAVETLTRNLLAVEGKYPFPDDPCQIVFGVRWDLLLDTEGIFSTARLLSFYYRRHSELKGRVDRVLSVLTSSPPPLVDALQPVEALVLTERPLIALRTARSTYDLLALKLAEDAEQLARPLRAMKLGVDRSAMSHAGMVGVLGQLSTAKTASDRAALTLDYYRRMVEGQLRPWAWALLQILGRTGAKAPELTSLREQLIAQRLPLLRDAAEAILPGSRNAAAHEDYLWDDDRKVLRVGDLSVTIDDLESAASRAYAFMCGAECAWRCMRAESPVLAHLLDVGDPPGGLRAIAARTAIAHFGANGLAVQEWTVDGGTLSVLLDALPQASVDPCFQAVMWASRRLERTERFVVNLPEMAMPAMDLAREPLDATFGVWLQAFRDFQVMPSSTFLPANIAARLAVEAPQIAVRAAAWLALDDALDAYLEAGVTTSAPMSKAIGPLICRLNLITTALAATIATLSQHNVRPLEEARELVKTAGESALLPARGLNVAVALQMPVEIRNRRDRYPVPALLPTVDARPLDQAGSDRLV